MAIAGNAISGGYVAVAGPKQSSVQEQLNELDKTIETIRANADALIAGMAPVLRDDPPAPTAERAALVSRCPIAEQIAKLDARLSSIAADLRGAYDRLEV